LAVLGGFAFKDAGAVLVLLRAASHIFWVLFLALYIKRFGLKKKKHLTIAFGVTAVLHAGFEIIAVIIGLAAGLGTSPTTIGLYFWLFVVVGLGTAGHNTLDFAVGLLVYKVSRVELLLKQDKAYAREFNADGTERENCSDEQKHEQKPPNPAAFADK